MTAVGSAQESAPVIARFARSKGLRRFNPASAPLLLLLHGAPALAVPEARVEVLGVGSVSLEDAMKTCLSEAPQGEIRVAQGSHRVAAFQDVLGWLSKAEPEARTTYFRSDQPWPVAPQDARYQPPLDWVPAGVIGACEAAGAWWVRWGIELSASCPSDRAACVEALTPDYAPEDEGVVKAALRGTKRGNKLGRDPFFAELNRRHETLQLWSDPQLYLQKACDLPQIAAGRRRFIDRQDLLAARRACIQIELLVQHAESPAPLGLACDTSWKEVTDDLPHLVTAPHTDLGMTGVFPDEQLDTLRDRLHRMDPTEGSCPDHPSWASLWRVGLAEAWRAAQQEGACSDPFVPLPQRLQLCPDLEARTLAACEGGEAHACGTAGAMLLDGIGAAPDPARATQLLIDACRGAHGPSCERVGDRTDALGRWLDERLGDEEAADADPPGLGVLEAAHALLLHLRPYVQGGWSRARVERLFAAAVDGEHRALAVAVLEAHQEHADPEWLELSRIALARLPEPESSDDEG